MGSHAHAAGRRYAELVGLVVGDLGWRGGLRIGGFAPCLPGYFCCSGRSRVWGGFDAVRAAVKWLSKTGLLAGELAGGGVG
jgi:hypothetical protein